MGERPLPPDIQKMIQEEIENERSTEEKKMDVGAEGASEAPGEAAEEDIGQMIEEEVGGPEAAAKKEGGEPLSEKFIATLKSEGEPPEPSEIDDIAVKYALKADNVFERGDAKNALEDLKQEYLAEVKKFSPKNEKGEIDDERFEPEAVVTKLQNKLKELHDARRDLGQEEHAAEIRAFSDSLNPSGAAERIGEATGVKEFLGDVLNKAETSEEREEYERTIKMMQEGDEQFSRSAEKKPPEAEEGEKPEKEG